MNLLMISGDRSMLQGRRGAFYYTLEAFSKEWDRIDVICPYVKGAAEAQSFFGNVYFHPCPRGLWYQTRWIRKMGKELIAHFRHGVMTIHEYPPFYNGLGAVALSRKTGVPAVLEVHHIVGHPVASNLAEAIGRMMSRVYLPRASRRVAAVRTVSKGTAETLLRWKCPVSKVFVVPSFYLDRQFYQSLREPVKQYDLAFCGRLVANKGLSDVIRSLQKNHATLLVIGDGPERAAMEALARELKVAPRVEFRGWLPTQEDVINAIRSARVLVMNSRSEGGPRVALEAMAAGVPVIATRVGVMLDVLADGWNGLFTTGTPEDLHEKITRILHDEALRETMGREATKVLDRFDRSILIHNYARFLLSFAT